MPNCSICGLVGHNKSTCDRRPKMPSDSAFFPDYKKIVQYNYDYAKKKQKEEGKKGPVFKGNLYK